MKLNKLFVVLLLVFSVLGAACQSGEAFLWQAASVQAEEANRPVVLVPHGAHAIDIEVIAAEMNEGMAVVETAVEPVRVETAVQPAQPVPAKPIVTVPQVTEQANTVAAAHMAATVVHTVKEGEWIYELARCYGSTPKAIIHANYLHHPNRIYPGQLLIIPNVGTTDTNDGPNCIGRYEVKAGDTWASIAAAHNSTEIVIMKANPGKLYVGRKLWVPIH